MKITDIIKSANHNLFRSKTRTFLTILAVFIGSFTIILNNAINSGVNDYIDKQVKSIGGDDFVEIFPSALFDQMSSMQGSSSKVKEYNEKTGSLMSAKISDEDIQKMRKVDGIKTVEVVHMLSSEWMRLENTEKKYDVSVEYFPEGNINVDLAAGRMTNNETSDYEILLNEDWIEAFGLKNDEEALGKTVDIAIKQTAKCYQIEMMHAQSEESCLEIVKAKVVGVQAPGILSIDGDLHINKALDARLYELQNENVPESSIQNYVAVGIIDPAKIEQIRKDLKDLSFEFMTVDDMAGMIRTFFDAILVVFNIFGGIALLAAAIGIINTLFMSVQERTREIGLMKAMGMSNGKVFMSFSVEAILLGFWGSVFGIAVSMIIGTIVNSVAHDTFLADFPTFNLIIFNPINMLIITAIIMLIAFLAGTLPARKASKKNPIDALRYE